MLTICRTGALRVSLMSPDTHRPRPRLLGLKLGDFRRVVKSRLLADCKEKVHGIFPKMIKSYLPSFLENFASNSERIIEKSRNFQIVFAGRTNLSKQTN